MRNEIVNATSQIPEAEQASDMTLCNKIDVVDSNVHIPMSDPFGSVGASRRPKIENNETKNVINPESFAYTVWQGFIIVTVIVNTCLVIVLSVFDSSDTSLWAITFSFDVIFAVNMVLTCFTCYKDEYGILITDRKEIIRHYLRGQFLIDLLSVLPTDLAVLAFDSDVKWQKLSLLRLNRLLRAYKVLSFFDRLEDDLDRSTANTRGLKYFAISILTLHTITSGWFGLACDGRHENLNSTCKANSWATTFDLGFKLNETTTTNAYVASLYWAVATATSTGYGDIYAVTIGEKWYSIFSMLLGISVFFGMLLGGMTSLLTNFDAHRAKYVHRFQTIKGYLEDFGIDPVLQDRVNNYYEYLWQQKNGVISQGIYNKLPVTFQAEISQAVNSDAIEKAQIFNTLDPGILRTVALSIKQVLYLPSQIIIKRGDMGMQMFYIQHGEVEIMSSEDDEKPVATLSSGKVFGEISLVFSLPRTASVRAKTHCDLLTLHKSDLQRITYHFPEVSDRLKEVAQTRLTTINELSKAARVAKKEYWLVLNISPAASYQRDSEETPLNPNKMAQPQWLRRASFIPKKDSAGSLNLEAETSPVKAEGGHGVQDSDLENLRRANKKRHGVNWKRRFNVLFSDTIEPTSRVCTVWTHIVLIVTIFNSFFHPYMASFTAYDGRKGFGEGVLGQALLVIIYLLDLVMILDVWITFRTEIVGEYANIKEKNVIAMRYIKSCKFWVDLAVVFPLEIICLTVTGGKKRWRVYSLLRLNKVLKLYKVFSWFSVLQQSLNVTASIVRVVEMLLYICLLSHWAACGMFLMVCSGDTCQKSSWVAERNQTVGMTGMVSEYISSLYWAAATMTSTGYGDISAVSSHGRFISLCIMLVGLLLYGYCLSLMAATLANEESPRVRFQEKLFAVRNYMREQNLSLQRQQQVINYMDLIWSRFRGDWMPGEDSLIHDAPTVLQEDLTFEDACKTIAKVPLFKYTDDNFLRNLALKLQQYLFNPGDVIIYAGDVGREIYCIRKGWCRILSSDGYHLADLGPGSYIGEVGLLFGDRRSATVIAITHCELVMLTLDDLHETLTHFPLIKEQFDGAEKRKAELMELKTRYGTRMYQEAKASGKRSLSSDTSMKLKKDRKSLTKFTDEAEDDYRLPFETVNVFTLALSKLLMNQVLLPTGRMLRAWTTTLMLVAVIQSFTVPLQAAFFHQNYHMWAFNYFLDVIYLVNMYLSFHIAFYNEHQVLVSHPLITAKHYLRTNFLFDLLATFPIEIFAFAAYPHFHYNGLYIMSLVRLNRLLQVYRLPMGFTYLESSVDKETGVLREIKFAFYSVIFLNWLTCTLFILACPPDVSNTMVGYITMASGHQCLDKSWIMHTNLDAVMASAGKLYVICLYWASATSVSVGYGDISTYTDTEMVVSLIAMVAGVIFFGYIIASVAASLANADAQRARFQEKMTSIDKYIKAEKVEENLQKRIIQYYNYVWLRTRGVDPESLFNVLPLALWGDVTLDIYEDTLKGIELFKNTETGFLKMLSRCIKPILFLKGEYVVRKFDMGDEMYFIQRGSVDVVSEDGTIVFASMQAGNSFGEVALLFSVPRTASIRAGTNADLFSLCKGDLDSVLELYPEVKEMVMNIAEERRQQARKRSAAKAAAQASKSKSQQKSSKLSVRRSSTSRRGSSTATSSGLLRRKDSIHDKHQEEADEIEMKEMEEEAETIEDEAIVASEARIDPIVDVLTDSDTDSVNENNSNINFNESNNAASWNVNQNNAGQPLDPDYGEFTTLEEWDMEMLARTFYPDTQSNQNQNNRTEASLNINQSSNPEDTDKDETEEAAEPSCCVRLLRRLQEINRFTIHPSSTVLNHFDSLMCLLGFVSIWIITFQASYQYHPLALIIVNYIFDLFFFIEIYVRFHTSFHDEYGELNEDFHVVYSNYLKTVNGFTVDMVAALPLDIFAFAAPSGEKLLTLSYLRIIHCVRLLRVMRYFDKWERGLNINMLAARLFKFFVVLVLMIHFLSCIWYTMACPLAECSPTTWIQNKAALMTSPFNSYCVCVYWTVATMTSTGYGDVYALNVIEMLYASVVMVAGKLMFGFILGNVASTLSNAEIQKVMYQEHIEVMKTNMISEKLPEDMQHQAVQYMIYLWYRTKGVDPQSLFSDAPVCLTAELFRKIANEMFEAIPLLHGCDESFLRALALCVKQVVYIPGNDIIKKGDVGEEAYFVHKGEVIVYEEGDKPLQTLREGDIFGEVSLLAPVTRRVSVTAKTHVDLFTLSMHDLDSVLESYPTVAAQIHHVGYKRFKDILRPDYTRTKRYFRNQETDA